MAHEDEQSSSHCDSGGGGVGSNNNKSSKSVKPKKVPQRGLGVAQLERIRLEEQKSASAFLTIQCSGLDPPSLTNLPSLNSASFRITNPSNEGGGEISTEAISSFENSNSLTLWDGDQHSNLEGKKQRVDDHLGFAFLPRRSHQFWHLSSSAVNASSDISPSPILSSLMEPPSNQILRYSNYASSSPEEDPKMVGMKRSYPFSLEKSTSDELPPRNSAKIESRNKLIRDERLNGDFLTLAPPKAASPPLSNSYQENIRSQVHQVFSFFPDKHIDENSTHVNNGNGEKGESIDLKLKL